MKGTKTLRTIGAVALSAAVGLGFSTSAQALMIDGGMSVTYAKETLAKDQTQTVEGVTYYDIAHTVALAGTADVSGNDGDTFLVSFMLDGLVFGAVVPVTGTTTDGLSTDGSATFTKARGGAIGDTSVVFRATSAVLSTETLTLTATLSVSASGGSVTMRIVNQNLESALGAGQGSKVHPPVSVRVMPALKEMVMATPGHTAKAVSQFMNFGTDAGGSDILHAKLGTLMVGVVGMEEDSATTPPTPATYYRNAQESDAAEAVNELIDIAPVDTTEGAPFDNAATVAGETSFVKMIGFTAESGCTSTANITDIRKPATAPATGYTDEFVPQNLDTFTTLMELCLMADGETPITAEEYTVTTKYTGVAMAAFPPMGGTHTIGSIGRDGTQYNIPFLTDDRRFKQRITIQNRGRASTWSLGSLDTVADSVMTLSGMGSGALPMGQTEIKVWEHIDVMGGSRASGSITIPLAPTSVSASVDIINPESGSVATTMLMAE